MSHEPLPFFQQSSFWVTCTRFYARSQPFSEGFRGKLGCGKRSLSRSLSLSLLGLSDVPSSLSTVVAFSMTHPSPQLSSPLQGKAPGIYKACTVAGCERGHEIELPRTRPAFTGRACRWNTGHSVKSEFQIHLTEHPGASVLVLPNLAALLATTSGWPPRAVESAFQSPGSLFCESSPSTRLTIVPPSNTTLKKTLAYT